MERERERVHKVSVRVTNEENIHGMSEHLMMKNNKCNKCDK